MSTRELGKVDRVHSGEEDPGIDTVDLGIDFKGGGHQGFGGLCLNDKKFKDSFIKELCETFGVYDLQDIAGKECYALRCWDGWNEPIEGIESVDTGRRFVISVWRKKMGCKDTDPLESKRDRYNRDIENALRRIKETIQYLKELDKGYVDWSKV